MTCFMTSVATIGKDGNEMKLEKKIGPIFHVLMLCLLKSPKNICNLSWLALPDHKRKGNVPSSRRMRC